jgi:hypothetical protein
MNITTGNSYNKKLDFYIFIKSFEIIANKLYPKLDLNESMKILMEKVNKNTNTNKTNKY